MFKEIFRFEVVQGFKKWSTYIYFFIFLVMGLLTGMAVAGVFNKATSDSNIWMNSCLSVTSVVLALNDNFMLLISAVIQVAIMATAIQKDYAYNMHGLLFTKPLTKSGYFFGRYAGAFVITFFVFSAQILGYYAGTLFGMGKPMMGPFNLMNYLEPFLVFTVPNLLLLGSIFFALTTYTRNTLSAYLFCIILLVINIVMASMQRNIDNQDLTALLDPFGEKALIKLTQFWTPYEQNHRMLPLTGVLIYNRLLWLGISAVITAVCFYKFRFSQMFTPFHLFKKTGRKEEEAPDVTALSLADIINFKPRYSFKDSLSGFWYMVRFEFRNMIFNNFFLIICALGVVLMVITSNYMDSIYDTETYPLTRMMMENLGGAFMLVIMIVIIFFSGNIVWRERERKVDELVGVTPVRDSKLYFSKWCALWLVIGVMLLCMCLSGIGIQTFRGFYHYQPLLYVQFALKYWVGLGITAGLAMAVQVVSPNKYLGFFITIIILALPGMLFGRLEWNDELYRFNSSGPALPYSDMNGFSETIYNWFVFKAYWLAFVLLIAILALAVFPRGKEKGLLMRFRLAKGSFSRGIKSALVLCLIATAGFGAFIFYNTHILNRYTTPKEEEVLQIAYEKLYKHLEKIDQPRIVSARLKVDIYPATQQLDIQGTYFLKNKHPHAIDTLIIAKSGGYNNNLYYKVLAPEGAYQILKDDTLQGIEIIKLGKALLPGDSIPFHFAMHYEPRGFQNQAAVTDIVENGTFFNSGYMPQFGYQPDQENGENAARKKYGLKERPRMAPINDTAAWANTYISNDADWIRFEAEVTTVPDQIAIAPGYLQKEWVANGRRHFIYKMDSPILNFYSFQSARYQVRKAVYKGISLEIYYQQGHEFNLDNMIKGMKRSLDYCATNYSPYQHRQVRIIEFPLYNTFAQSFPNTIPFSEGIGFITRVNPQDDSKIDVPFYVTAHEVAHQWWAHQVIGANVQGAVVMSETMAQYVSLMVMKQEYGRAAMKKFLQYEMNMYLSSRAGESKYEVPLILCENQAYIHYRKGSVVMYELQDLLGEPVLNRALQGYLHQVAFQEPPYTIAYQFLDAINRATPDSMKYAVKDMFQEITLYENYVKALSYTRLPNGKFRVTLTVGAAKFQAAGNGRQVPVKINDYVDIGVLGKLLPGSHLLRKELALFRAKITRPETTFTVDVDGLPEMAGIDPYNKLIDRNPENNTCRFGTTPQIPDLKAANDNNNVEVKVSL